jgi:glycosyltransferase involved in cell wall biosynthesis
VRILWLGNALWSPSGYGEQGAMFIPRFRALGHDVAVASNFGLQATTIEWNGITHYPASLNWGNPAISTFAEQHRADAVIALCDAWVMKPDEWELDRMAIWAPIDHYPIPPAVLATLKHDKVQPIAMSRDGETWMQRFGLDPLYVPHGVDTKLFRPQPEIKCHVRRELGIPEDAFLVGMVAANKGSPQFPRKGFPQAFEAFGRFAMKHDDAWLYVHTEAQPKGGGIQLETLCQALMALNSMPSGRVKFPPPKVWQLGFPRQLMANLYAAFDVLLNPSMGEGFGIPLLEAQACGVPVIASDHSAMSELTQAGWLVTGDRWWDALQESFAIVPSIGSIEAALEAAYDARGDEKLSAAAAEFAQLYDADLVTVEYWEPVLEKLGKPREIPPLNGKVSRQVRRAEARKREKAKA